MVLGSEIRDPEKTYSGSRIRDPGSRGQKGTGSRIRIRNTEWSLLLLKICGEPVPVRFRQRAVCDILRS
jgi:hypothetical protein